MFTFVLNETERKPPNSLTQQSNTCAWHCRYTNGMYAMECTYKYMQMDDDANEILGWQGGGVHIQDVSIYVEYVS